MPGEQTKLDGILKLNTNENPYAPSPTVLDAIASATDRLHLYPDPFASSLRETIATRYDVVRPRYLESPNLVERLHRRH